MKRIYFDNNATTRPDPRVIEKVMELAGSHYGNPSSLHFEGQQAKRILEESRRTVAAAIGAEDSELIFTSGGTEANNLAIKGVVEALAIKGKHLIASAIEHSSVRLVVNQLSQQGFEVTRLPVDKNGIIDLDFLQKNIRKDTILVSIMLANNELGTIEPIPQAAEIAHRQGALFHTDAVQALAKMSVKVDELGVDLLSVSGHKVYAFKGVGALYVRKKTPLLPTLHGGGHEQKRRAGTENLVGIASLAEAVRIMDEEGEQGKERLRLLRDRLEKGLKEKFPSAQINAESVPRVPNTTNVSFPGIDGESLLMNLDAMGIAVSAGSACKAGSTEPSHVLQAIGLSKEAARGTLRVSLGKYNTGEEVDYFLKALEQAIAQIKRGD